MFILALWWSRISPAAGVECSVDSLRSAPLNHLLYKLTITSPFNIPSYPGRDRRNDYSLGREGRRGHTARHLSNRYPRRKSAGMSFNRAGGTALRPWGIRFSIPSYWGRRPQAAAVPCGTAAAGRSERAQRALSAASSQRSEAVQQRSRKHGREHPMRSSKRSSSDAPFGAAPPIGQNRYFVQLAACLQPVFFQNQTKKKKNGKYRVELCRIRAFCIVFCRKFRVAGIVAA